MASKPDSRPPLACLDCLDEACNATYWSRDTAPGQRCECGERLYVRTEGREPGLSESYRELCPAPAPASGGAGVKGTESKPGD